MSKPNDGGAAFPCETDTHGRSFCYNKVDAESPIPFKVAAQSGMTLRQWYAAMPINIDELNSIHNAFFAEYPERKEVSLCELRFFHADQMIAESQKEICPPTPK